jgi:hypothetical protein
MRYDYDNDYHSSTSLRFDEECRLMTFMVPILFVILLAVGGLAVFTGWENVRQTKAWKAQPARIGRAVRLDWGGSEAREMK